MEEAAAGASTLNESQWLSLPSVRPPAVAVAVASLSLSLSVYPSKLEITYVAHTQSLSLSLLVTSLKRLQQGRPL